MKYGYARVSTVSQDLAAQLQALEKEGCEKIYSEKFTGTPNQIVRNFKNYFLCCKWGIPWSLPSWTVLHGQR